MEDIRKKCNLMINLSKFTSHKKKFCGVVIIGYNQVCIQTLFFIYYIMLLGFINHM